MASKIMSSTVATDFAEFMCNPVTTYMYIPDFKPILVIFTNRQTIHSCPFSDAEGSAFSAEDAGDDVASLWLSGVLQLSLVSPGGESSLSFSCKPDVGSGWGKGKSRAGTGVKLELTGEWKVQAHNGKQPSRLIGVGKLAPMLESRGKRVSPILGEN